MSAPCAAALVGAALVGATVVGVALVGVALVGVDRRLAVLPIRRSTGIRTLLD